MLLLLRLNPTCPGPQRQFGKGWGLLNSSGTGALEQLSLKMRASFHPSSHTDFP